MAFTGTYTVYYANTDKTDKKERLAGLFGTGPFIENGKPTTNLVEVESGRKFLTPRYVVGNPMFPGTGFNLEFDGSPNLGSYAWEKPGDPSTAFSPDQRSPGNTVSATTVDGPVAPNLTPLSSNGQRELTDVKPGFNGSDGTQSPSATRTPRIVKIGSTLSLGSSDPTKSFT